MVIDPPGVAVHESQERKGSLAWTDHSVGIDQARLGIPAGMYAQMIPVVRSDLRDVERKKSAFWCIKELRVK